MTSAGTTTGSGTSRIGRTAVPSDWRDRTTGRTVYAGDVSLEGQLEAVIVRSPHAHAEIISIDVEDALAMRGVHHVLTAADFAGGVLYEHRGGHLSDRPPLPTDRVLFYGQEVAVVAAESRRLALRAAAAVRVRYRPLAAPSSVSEARRPGAPTLHSRSTPEPNVSVRWQGAWGSGSAAFDGIATEVSGTFHFPSVSQAAMEPGVTLARWDSALSRMELWTSTQAPYFVAKEIAHVLGLDLDQVIVREVAVGGGFGAKSKICEHEVLAARLSMITGRPVMLRLSRREEFVATKPRHRFSTTLRLGADGEGRLRALEADVLVDNGAFNHHGSSVMKVGVLALGSVYELNGATFDARLVDTAKVPGGQFRGYGIPQTSFALESLVDEIAKRTSQDPLAFRIENSVGVGPTLSGSIVNTNSLRACLETVRTEMSWDAKRAARRPFRGVGVAIGMHGSGSYAYEGANRSEARIDVGSDGSVTVGFGSADAGTGQRVIIAQAVAEILDVEPGDVRVIMMDSQETPFDMGAWSSRGTHMALTAVQHVAGLVAARLLEMGKTLLGGADVVLDAGTVRATDGTTLTFGEVVARTSLPGGALSVTSGITVDGIELLTPEALTANLSPSYAFAAHGVEVEIDPRTGRITILDYVAAHDVGTAVNPTQVRGQICGGVIQGLGAALGEELITTHGQPTNPNFINYAVPRAGDRIPVRPVIVDALPDSNGPFGAKSVGEMAIGPVASALANAVADALDVRPSELPLTPDRILGLIGTRRHRHAIWRRPSRWWVAFIRMLYPRGLDSALIRLSRRFSSRDLPRDLEAIHRPSTTAEAAVLLDGERRIIGGGTDLHLTLRDGIRPTSSVVSVARIEEMRGIRGEIGEELTIGGATTLASLAHDDRCPSVLREAIATIASPQVRNVATVAGNLLQDKRCWYFRNDFDCYKRAGVLSPCYAVLGDHRFQHAVMDAHRCQAITPSDLATALMALDASVQATNVDRARSLTIEELYVGPGETCLESGELIDKVIVPARSRDRVGVFEKLQLSSGDFSVVSVAVAAEVGSRASAGIVFGGLAPTPWRAKRSSRALAERRGRSEVLATFRRELDRCAHPLPRNSWKLDAAEGLLLTALERLEQWWISDEDSVS